MVLVEKLITDNLDIWASAVKTKSNAGRGNSNKIELYGTKKLRKLIIDLALRGLLVHQSEEDKPARDLLEKIEAERKSLIDKKEIKNRPPLPPVENEEKTYPIPSTWEYVRWGHVAEWAIGSGFPKSAQGEKGQKILFSKVSDMNLPGNEKHILNTSNTISEQTAKKIKAKIHKPGTVIFPKIGGAIATNKRRIISKPTAIDNNCLGLTPFKGLSTDYLFLVLCGTDLTVYQSGTSVPALSQSNLEVIVIGLPPENEQHRIVAKVDELMALCDQLEQQTEASISAHQTLVETLLGALTNAPDHASFQQAWQRIAEHFDTLFTTENSIEQLEKALLKLAVLGKLSSAREEGETASNLVAENFAVQHRLIHEENLKTKASETVDEKEQYLATPEHWRWIRLGNLAKFIDYRGRTPKKLDNGVRLITAKNVRFGHIDLHPEEFISEDEYKVWMTRGIPRLGDILFTPEAPLGNVAIIDIKEKFALAQRAICLQLHLPELANYLLAFIMSDPFQEKLKENATGMTATGIKAAKLKEIPIPIPPLAEQKAITNKLGELTLLTKRLSDSILNRNVIQLGLADSISGEAIK